MSQWGILERGASGIYMKSSGFGGLRGELRREIWEAGRHGLPRRAWRSGGALWLSSEQSGRQSHSAGDRQRDRGTGRWGWRDEVLEAWGGVSSSGRAGEGQRVSG